MTIEKYSSNVHLNWVIIKSEANLSSKYLSTSSVAQFKRKKTKNSTSATLINCASGLQPLQRIHTKVQGIRPSSRRKRFRTQQETNQHYLSGYLNGHCRVSKQFQFCKVVSSFFLLTKFAFIDINIKHIDNLSDFNIYQKVFNIKQPIYAAMTTKIL